MNFSSAEQRLRAINPHDFRTDLLQRQSIRSKMTQERTLQRHKALFRRPDAPPGYENVPEVGGSNWGA